MIIHPVDREGRDEAMGPWRLLWPVLAAVPYVAVLLLMFFAWHTSRATGSWPTYANPDPKSANQALYLVSGLTALAAVPSVAVLSLGLPVLRGTKLVRREVAIIAAGIIGLLLLVLIFAGDLGNWYMD